MPQSGGKEEYTAYYKAKMKEHGLDGISGVDEAKLKKFFTDVDKGWSADKESSDSDIPDRIASLASAIRAATKE